MRKYLIFATASAMLAVLLGAFGAHGLKAQLSEALLNAFTTGVQYQMTHSLALIMLVLLFRQQPHKGYIYVARLLVAGIILFSGSLYVMALFKFRAIGWITPIGGTLLISGWLVWLITVIRAKR